MSMQGNADGVVILLCPTRGDGQQLSEYSMPSVLLLHPSLLQLIQRSVSIPYHRIIEWLSLKGTLKTIYFHPPAIGRIASSHQARWAFLKKMLLPMHLLRCSVLGFCAPGIQLSWCGREAAALAHEISRIGPFQVLFTL